MPDDRFKWVKRRGYLTAVAGILGAGAGAGALAKGLDQDAGDAEQLPAPNNTNAGTTAADNGTENETAGNETETETPDGGTDDGSTNDGESDTERYATAVARTVENRLAQYTLRRETIMEYMSAFPPDAADAPLADPDDTYYDSQYVIIRQGAENLDDPGWFERNNDTYAHLANRGFPVFSPDTGDEEMTGLGIKKGTYHYHWRLDNLADVYTVLAADAEQARQRELELTRAEDPNGEYDPIDDIGERSLDSLYQETVSRLEEYDEDAAPYERLDELADRIESADWELEITARHYDDTAAMIRNVKKHEFWDGEDGECVER